MSIRAQITRASPDERGVTRARFNRQLPRPSPSRPKALRAFVTTAASRLVSDRDNHIGNKIPVSLLLPSLVTVQH
jgi:hypothetical protein